MDDANIADKIIEANTSGQKHIPKFFRYQLPERDDLGIPTANCLDYLIARIIYIDYNRSGREHLHLREYDDMIWEGDHWLAEKSANLYRLLKWKGRPLNADQQAMVWSRLREILPVLSDKKLVIKDNLVYDKETGELYYEDEPPLTIN